MNQIEQKYLDFYRLEDELDDTLIKNVQNLNSVNETNDDSPGWGTIILQYVLFGWLFGD